MAEPRQKLATKYIIGGLLLYVILLIAFGIFRLHQKFGEEYGIVERFQDGSKKREILKEPTYFDTSCGKIKLDSSVCYHKTGKIRSAFFSEHQFINTPVVNDPGELENLANKPEFSEELKKHRAYLVDWSEKHNDPFKVPDV